MALVPVCFGQVVNICVPAETRVRLFSLQSDIWQPPRDDVYVRFNMTSSRVEVSSLTEVTVCTRIFLTAITKLQVFLSYATADRFANAIMFCEL
ncbi:hypothetical protein E2C01_005120 [Portunus trituberculatus]|uniref:Uncharacterized protein n=1 Tax=Portunus trituberculatus TaxID=210409 RepID=A0A5B7CVS5_PORTR|nr:hypothetical protein [Portunus trituberculatus]